MSKYLIADVLVNHSGKKSIFSYKIPENISDQLKVGHIISVPLRNNLVHGVVWKISTPPSGLSKINFKDVKKIIHPDLYLLPYQKKLAEWMSLEFIASLADCVFCFLPVIKRPPKVSEQPAASSQQEIEGGGQQTAGSRQEEKNYKLRIMNYGKDKKIELNSEQVEALKIIKKSLRPVLLHGVTGSGKTEVYLQYAERLLNEGKQVLILVPEIALTPQTKKRFFDRFGDTVAVWHSELSMAERRSEYWDIRLGNKKLVVGSRSALFLPFPNLGLIVIDEEHEKTFYQESSPRYSAISVAEEMSKLLNCQLILGSATPSLESVWKASLGEYSLAIMDKRAKQVAMPESVIIDLRHEKMIDNSFISHPLFDYLNLTLEENRQSVLLLNRRGHSTAALCTTCGNILMCKNCNVPLTTHHVYINNVPNLICHHCDHRELLPDQCFVCKSPSITLKGFGTEKVETDLKRLFPTARILRMDRDTTSTRSTIDNMYHDFANHKYDILIGTQMIAKGWDIPAVDMVGVLLAESGLMLPDYHAASTTFNLLVQVSGRSGRGSKIGKTIIQTYQPDHPLIRSAAMHNFGEFAKSELKTRQQFNYPPFSKVIRILYQHSSESKCQSETFKLAQILSREFTDGFELLGPAPCFFERLRGKYRYHIILKLLDDKTLLKAKTLLKDLASPWVVEVNPPQLL